MMSRRTAILGTAVLPISALPLAGMQQPIDCRYVTPEQLGWTAETTPRETAKIINQALQIARETGVTYFDNAERRIAGTIRLGGKVNIEFGSKHVWRVDYRDLSVFDKISNTEKSIFVDLAYAAGSNIRGSMKLVAANPKNMSLNERRKIPKDLVALSSSMPPPSSEISIEQINIVGFGYGLHKPDNDLKKRPLNLPFTRMNIGIAAIQYCIEAISTGNQANGFDDAVFQILRLARNCGNSVIHGTELNITSFFNYGLNFKADVEPGFIQLRAGSHYAQIPTDSLLSTGMTVVAIGAGEKIRTGRRHFTTKVLERNEGDLLLEDTPEYDFNGPFIASPPSFTLEKSGINSLHIYIEGVHDFPIQLQNGSKISTLDFKVSGGDFAGRSNYAIAVTGPATSVDLHLNAHTARTQWAKGYVGIFAANANPSGRIVTGLPFKAGHLVGDARPAQLRSSTFKSSIVLPSGLSDR